MQSFIKGAGGGGVVIIADRFGIIPCEQRLGEDMCLQGILVELQRRHACKGS